MMANDFILLYKIKIFKLIIELLKNYNRIRLFYLQYIFVKNIKRKVI